MMWSLVGDQLGGGHQEKLQGRGTFEEGCCACGVRWDACEWEALVVWREGKTSGRGKGICKDPEA